MHGFHRRVRAAEANLAEIWVYLATEILEEIANRFVADTWNAFDPVGFFPLGGPERENLGRGLRATFCGLYAICYRPEPDALVIIRVLHGARDVTALAERGGFVA